MDPNSLVTEPLKAAEYFLKQLDTLLPLAASLLIKDADDGQWRLYVAPQLLTLGSADHLYREIARISANARYSGFEPIPVRMMAASDNWVRTAVAMFQHWPRNFPLHLRGEDFGEMGIEEVVILSAPDKEFPFLAGREVLQKIIDREAQFLDQHGRRPAKMKLPVLMAYDLAKCDRDDLGELSGRIFKDGIAVLEKEGFHGMEVEIVRAPDADLQLK